MRDIVEVVGGCFVRSRQGNAASALVRGAARAALATGLALMSVPTAFAAVQACTEAGLDAALSAGGTNTFACGAATTITVSATKAVAVTGTVLDGGGLLTISGGNARRAFNVSAGVSATFQNLKFTDGKASDGGAIFNIGELTVLGCTFSANSATGGGGAILNVGTLVVRNSTFSGNSAADGGALSQNGTALTIGNSTLTGNSANRGGGILISDGPVIITNSTLSGNTTVNAFGGGGLFGAATLVNTIVAGNNAGGGRNCNGGITAGQDSLADDSTCGAAKVRTSAQIGLGTLTGSPAYFPLNPGSAAIDAGNNAACAAAPVNNTSQNGVTRPADGDGNGTATCDIGSFEAPAGSAVTASVIEFYNGPLDHYFITADAVEAAAIDGGAAGPGWTRTGQNFKSGGPNKMCRFYGNANTNPATGTRYGPNSHFYTLDAAECASLVAQWNPNAKSWHFESYDFDAWPKTGTVCPAGTVPVLRVYNNGFARGVDSNHRYMTSQTIYNQMVSQGWAGEGSVFCVVP